MPLFGSRGGPDEVRFDPDMGDPKMTQLREIAAARDWLSLEFFFEQIDNWADQAHYVHHFSRLPDTEHWLYHMGQRDDQGTLAPLLLAARRIEVGRGARLANPEIYLSELALAEQILSEIVFLEPDNAAAWAVLLKTARGLGLGLAEARHRYEQVAGLSPHNLTAQLEYLLQLSPRWGGSAELMHAFAREAALAAPAGGRHGELIAWAHLEHFATLDPREQRHYFRREGVLAEIHDAAQRSVQHPDYGGTHALLGYSTFAMIYFLANDYASAREQFSRMGNTAIGYPWDHFYIDPENIFPWARGITLRKG